MVIAPPSGNATVGVGIAGAFDAGVGAAMLGAACGVGVASAVGMGRGAHAVTRTRSNNPQAILKLLGWGGEKRLFIHFTAEHILNRLTAADEACVPIADGKDGGARNHGGMIVQGKLI
jgi:hypothetical protein